MSTATARARRAFTPTLSILFIIILITTGAFDAHAAVVYVDPTAGGLNNGTSWADAYTDLQVALGSAVSGDQLWVVVGTYYPHPSDRTVSFQLKNGVTIYGGFVGTETSVLQRSNVFATILSGDLGIPDNEFDNSYHVVNGSGTDATAVLDGCTITRGFANGFGSDVNGGGIYCDAGSPTLRNISLFENEAGSGGGIYCGNNSNPSLNSVAITSNIGGIGGGMFTDASSPTLFNIAFSTNTTTGSGGAAFFNNGSAANMTNVSFSSNTADFQGGAAYYFSSAGTITNAVFANNVANQFGGGIVVSDIGTPTFTNITMRDNTATTQSGGAIAVQVSSAPVIINCILWGNNAGVSDDEIHILPLGGSPVVSYSIVAGGLPFGATDAGNNLTADPLYRGFQDTRISPGSPAIDAGDTSANSEPIDAWFRPRVVGAAIDIGAYEFACPTAGPVVYVDKNVFGLDEGTSWATAFREVQDAIALVDFCGGSNEIWVADGVYRTSDPAPLDRTLTFELLDGIAIYGGFAGSETMRSQRDWTVNESILTGEIGMAPFQADNAYHVVTADGVGPTAVLDGFIIEDGFADGSAGNDDGAGLYVTNASPTLANLVVRNNEATNDGGGMAALSGSFPELRDVRFENNVAGLLGGGVYNEASSPGFTNVIFEENASADAGGGMTNWNASQPGLVNCIFLNNTTVNGGGGIYNYQSFPALINGSFYGNDGGQIGGAVLNIEFSTPLAVNCIMWGNTAAAAGPEIYNDNMFGGATSTNVQNSLIAGCGGSGAGWNPAIGVDNGFNLDTDPLFRDPLAGDLQLPYNSPAINKGDNGSNPEAFDIAGSARIVDMFIDMGAYEYPAPVGIGDAPQALDTAIQSAFPNPFNPTVSISFTLRDAGHVELLVYNVRGALVTTLADRSMSAGSHTVQWNGHDNAGRQQASGVYMIRLRSGGQTSVEKVVMLK